LNAYRFGICDYGASNSTAFSGHTRCFVFSRRICGDPMLGWPIPAGQGGGFGKVHLGSGAIAHGEVVSADALRRRSEREAATEPFTLLDQIVEHWITR
jgi:hypothetical protein